LGVANPLAMHLPSRPGECLNVLVYFAVLLASVRIRHPTAEGLNLFLKSPTIPRPTTPNTEPEHSKALALGNALKTLYPNVMMYLILGLVFWGSCPCRSLVGMTGAFS